MDRPRRHHYAIAVEKVRGGYRVTLAVEMPSRGEADRYSLSMMARYDDTDAITLDRELVEGEVLPAAVLKR